MPVAFRYATVDPFADAPSFRDCRALYQASGLVVAGGIDATQTKTLAKSSDRGATWAYMPTDPFGAGRCFAVLNDGSRIIAGGDRPANPLKYSDDGGVTWHAPAHQFQNTTGPRTGIRVLAYGAGSTVWAGGWGVPSSSQPDGVAVSTDGGAIWSDPSPNPFAFTSGFNAFCLDLSVSGSAVLAVGGDSSGNSIAHSSDGGATWSHLTEAFNNNDTEACLISGSRLLVGGFPTAGFPALKYSDDSGASWHDPTFNGATTVSGCSRIAKVGGDLWAGLDTDVASGQLFVSSDNGGTWDLPASQPFADPLFNTQANAIIIQGSTVIVGGTSADLAHTIAYQAGGVWTIGRLAL